jgi:hypothetical protein
MNVHQEVLTARYAHAVEYAGVIHATQTRNGTNIAYISHLLGVSSLVLEAGGNEDEAIAGLLHDAVEDCGGLPRLADVRARFGDRVADIVLACSDSHRRGVEEGHRLLGAEASLPRPSGGHGGRPRCPRVHRRQSAQCSRPWLPTFICRGLTSWGSSTELRPKS